MGPGSRVEPVLEAIVATAARLCGAEFALAYVRKEDGLYHTVAANRADAELVRYAVEHPLSPGQGSLIGRATLEGGPVHVEDCLADPDYAYPEFQRIGRFRTMLGVPLMRDGVAVGALGLLRSSVSPFSQAQIELVTTFADQAVIAIENVRLFQEVRARTDELGEALRQQTAIELGPDSGAIDQTIWKTLGLEVEVLLCSPVHQNRRYLGAIELGRAAGAEKFNPGQVNALAYICEQFAEFIADQPLDSIAEAILRPS